MDVAIMKLLRKNFKTFYFMLITLFENVGFVASQRKRTIINALWEKFNISLILFVSANSLKCYTDIEGRQITKCKENEGFRTCFTKYNDSKYLEDLFLEFYKL